MTDLHVDRSTVVVPAFDGFGAQYNQNVYAAISRDAGVTDENLAVMEREVAELEPQLVRVFFSGKAFTDPDLMQSFRRTLKLAQTTASSINVTFQGIGPHAFPDAMPAFAEVLRSALVDDGIDRLGWVTIRNEPNVPAMPQDFYRNLYVQLDGELTRLGVRSRIRFMGGDLRIENQKDWLTFLGDRMHDLLDAYSVHIYWSYVKPRDALHGIEGRLAGVKAIRDGLDPAGRKPLYVTEYGARGLPEPGETKADPGLHRNGAPLSTTTVNAFQHAWFSLRACMLGYHGLVKWDAYFGMYDANEQGFSAIGRPGDGWPLQPVYRLLRLLTTTVSPGGRVVAVDGADEATVVTAFDGPDGRLTILGLDTSGGTLDDTSPTESPYDLTGLPADTTFRLHLWNAGGDGLNTLRGRPRSDASGALSLTAPLHTVFALTTPA